MESILLPNPARCPSGPDHINPQPTPRGRGRPPKVHDNSRVSAFLIAAAAVDPTPGDWRDNTNAPARDPAALVLTPWKGPLDDVITGAKWLQSAGQDSSRPLSRVRLLRVLSGCPTISPRAVGQALGGAASRSTVDRYAASARVASKAIAGLLDRHPGWEADVVADSAYLLEVQGLGLA